jgi:hypothetical protein
VLEARVPAPRLPLLFEFEGVCHAGEMAILPHHRFHYCNRGNAKGNCASFPSASKVTAVRFTVTAVTSHSLTVLVLEEHDHWPGVHRHVDFLIDEQRLQPDIADICRRAQVLTFCRSYLEKIK